MTEMQKTLKQLERTLAQFTVSGKATIIMGNAFQLLCKAQTLEDTRVVEQEDQELEGKEERNDG